MLCLVALLAACGDPRDTRVPADISKWSTIVKPALQKLPHEDQVLFADYVRRHTVGATGGLIGDKTYPMPEDLTIGKAIEEQRDYVARQQAGQEHPPADKSGN